MIRVLVTGSSSSTEGLKVEPVFCASDERHGAPSDVLLTIDVPHSDPVIRVSIRDLQQALEAILESRQ